MPQTGTRLVERDAIARALAERGVRFGRWEAATPLAPEANAEAVLASYAGPLRRFMDEGGYASADVVTLDANTPDVAAVRARFLQEHTHSEDEVRLFVAGSGEFWFRFDDDVVMGIRCVEGDLMSVPAGMRHWFDCGETPFVKAIRVFSDTAGWTPHYTGDELAVRYVGLLSPQPGA